MPKISVIIPVYNIEKYLRRCLDSIVQQTFEELEIICIDDGSTDSCPYILKEYADRDSRIRVVHKENGGLVSARKAGLRIATGAYIGYVDGDDWIEHDFYEYMINDMVHYQVDMVETEHFIDAGERSSQIKSNFPYGVHDAKELIPVMLCDQDFNECQLRPYLWSKLFKKDLLDRHQMRVDEKICSGEDIAVTYPYMLDAERIYIADYAGYHYVQRPDSMTGIQSPSSQENDKALILYLKTVFDTSENYSGIMQKQLNQYTKSMLLIRQIGFFDRNSDKKRFLPFGGIEQKSRIALYGAGRMGKSIYQYLQTLDKENAVIWADKEYLLYQQMGLPVISPDEIVAKQEEYDVLLVAVSSKRIAERIKSFLIEKGLKKNKMAWLTDNFISEDNSILETYLED